MKTVQEAIVATQKKKAGFVNRLSVKYAETLLLPGENVKAAVVANIRTKKDSYPGVVVITDQRVMSVCGLPGIKRSSILPIAELTHCEEQSSVIQYKAVMSTRNEGFSMTVDPDVGDVFTQFVAELNGEELEAVKLKVDGHVLNPNMIARRKREKIQKEKYKNKAASADIELQKKAAAMFDNLGEDNTAESKPVEDVPAAETAVEETTAEDKE